jgi:hypothetical protein
MLPKLCTLEYFQVGISIVNVTYSMALSKTTKTRVLNADATHASTQRTAKRELLLTGETKIIAKWYTIDKSRVVGWGS